MCHCKRNGFLVANPRISTAPMESGCSVSIFPVLQEDAGLWECQSPKPLQKSDQNKLKVLGWLGTPQISEETKILFKEGSVCHTLHTLKCEAAVNQSRTKIQWLEQQTKTPLKFVGLSDSLSYGTSDTTRLRHTTISFCLDQDLDLICHLLETSELHTH